MRHEGAKVFLVKSSESIAYKKVQNGVFLPALTMACPFLQDVVDEEALMLRKAFRRERVFRDRLDPTGLP